MNCFKVNLLLRSPLGTPLAADTLFGHICWGIRYAEGEPALEDFLQKMRTPEPPIIFSNPFPSGFLPAPVLAPLTPGQREELLNDIQRMDWTELAALSGLNPPPGIVRNPGLAQAHDILKTLSRTEWLPLDMFTRCAKQFSAHELIKIQLQQKPARPPQLVTTLTTHNRVNRLGGGTVEGGLFYTEDSFAPQNSDTFDLYILTQTYKEDHIRQVLNNALVGGYGRDKSTGKGVIDIEQIQPCRLPSCENPNAVMLLGPCAPAPEDPVQGFWQIATKFGKLGGHWAVGPGPNGKHNPFKKPVTMLQQGSTLFTESPNSFYGRMITSVHPDFPQVVHYGLAMALPIRSSMQEAVT